MTTTTRHARTGASVEAKRHPLDTREKRTAVNYALRAKGIGVKACSICWVIKPTTAFNKKGNASDGLDPHCRACNSARHADRKANDPVYSQRHRDSARTSARKRYAVMREQITKQVRERRAGYVAKNAARVKDPSVLRRCAGQCGQVLPETEFRLNRSAKDGLRDRCNRCADACKRGRQACLKAYGDPVGQGCYLCGNQITVMSDAWVDHVIPQCKGGPDTADNVRWTHGVCNMRRQNYPLTFDQLQRALAFGPLPSSLSGELL